MVNEKVSFCVPNIFICIIKNYFNCTIVWHSLQICSEHLVYLLEVCVSEKALFTPVATDWFYMYHLFSVWTWWSHTQTDLDWPKSTAVPCFWTCVCLPVSPASSSSSSSSVFRADRSPLSHEGHIFTDPNPPSPNRIISNLSLITARNTIRSICEIIRLQWWTIQFI